MSGTIDSSNTQGYFLNIANCTSGCSYGTLVAQDPATGYYVPASAEWSTEVRSDGSWIPSYKAYVKGIIISDVVDGNATLLCTGWTTVASSLDTLGLDQGVGDYYLTTDGKATRGDDVPREMRVYCYSYLGGNTIYVRPALPEYTGHAHNYIEIPEGMWTPVSQAPTGANIPAGATDFVNTEAYASSMSSGEPYQESTAEAIDSMLRAIKNPYHVCLVKNGTEVMPSDYGVSQGTGDQAGKWFLYINFARNSGTDDVFSVHAITPLTANEPIVRSVNKTRGNSLMTISNVGGNVYIGVNNVPLDNNAFTGTGVVSLNDDGLKIGPVVQGLKAGPGIQLSNYINSATHETVPGVQVITATQFAGTMVDMNVCNLDRVVMGTSFNGISYVFPQGTASTLIGTMRVPHYDADGNVPGSLVFVFQGNGGSIGGLTATVIIQALPTAGAVPLATPVNYTVPTVPSTGSTNTGYCYKSTVNLGTSLQSDALVILKLTSAGDSAITLVSASLVLQ